MSSCSWPPAPARTIERLSSETAGAGVDTLLGGEGADMFVLDGNLTSADRIDGGTGSDNVVLEGDYSVGLVLSATTIANAEQVTVKDAFSYRLILDNATNATSFTVDASARHSPAGE